LGEGNVSPVVRLESCSPPLPENKKKRKTTKAMTPPVFNTLLLELDAIQTS